VRVGALFRNACAGRDGLACPRCSRVASVFPNDAAEEVSQIQRAMQDTPAVVALRDDIARGLRPSLHSALYEKVCAVVDELKAAGWPPERVIVAVKRIADEAGVRPSKNVLSRGADITDDDALIVQMVKWCIERYYRRDD
jgi:hypothetical protein